MRTNYSVIGTLVLLFGIGLSTDLRAASALSRSWRDLLLSPIVRLCATLVLLLVAPWVIVHVIGIDGLFSKSHSFLLMVSIALAGMIAYTWCRYLTWLDVFEPERARYMLIAFGMGALFSIPVPYVYDWIQQAFGMHVNGEKWNDLGYSVSVIGGVEETAKFLPLLILMFVTRQVDEPYDFILYGSLSALGFSFMENIAYLQATGLSTVMGRALTASVAHMMFTSVIAYGIALRLHKKDGSALLTGLLCFLIASSAHGFYDFWLLSDDRPHAISLLFFLGCAQWWVVMKNNLIDLSPQFNTRVKLGSSMFRYRIMNGTLAVLGVAYIAMAAMGNAVTADRFLWNNSYSTSCMLLLIAMNFSSFALIEGYVEPFRISALKRGFVPRMDWEMEMSGMRVTLHDRPHSALSHWRSLAAYLPVEGAITARVAADGRTDFHLFVPDKPMAIPGVMHDQFLLVLHKDFDALFPDKYVLMELVGLKRQFVPAAGEIDADNMVALQYVLAKEITGVITPN